MRFTNIFNYLVSIFVLYKDFIENTVTAENFLCEEIPRNTNVQKLLLSNSSQSYIAFIVNEKNASGMTDSRMIFGWVNILKIKYQILIFQ